VPEVFNLAELALEIMEVSVQSPQAHRFFPLLQAVAEVVVGLLLVFQAEVEEEAEPPRQEVLILEVQAFLDKEMQEELVLQIAQHSAMADLEVVQAPLE
jgi:hypothetical protein